MRDSHPSRRRLRWLARRLERPVGARSRLLDVGANGGFLVEAARELGFEAVGVELDPVSVDYAARHFAGSRFVRGTVEDLAAAGEPTFDAVYCSEVIEHVPDPNGFISGIVALMRPGALLYLTTPDIGHWRRPRDIRAGTASARPPTASISRCAAWRASSPATRSRPCTAASPGSPASRYSRAEPSAAAGLCT